MSSLFGRTPELLSLNLHLIKNLLKNLLRLLQPILKILLPSLLLLLIYQKCMQILPL